MSFRLLRGSLTARRRGLPTLWSRPFASAPPPPKPVSPHIAIYRDFGRPFAKVFLMAVFTYQAFYWTWLKLEAAEQEREKAAEVAALEAEVAKLQDTSE